jgi:hypothetical protein
MDDLAETTPPPSGHPSNLPTIVPKPMVHLPAELHDVLASAGLHSAFACLSWLQQSGYADWVADSPFAAVRSDRAHLVCRVLRSRDF